MRGVGTWAPATHETAKMSSVLGLPTKGSDITILITKVHLHRFCVLVEFWGKFSQERTTEYLSLAQDIQSPGNTFQEFEGTPGDQCLVQKEGTWYRCRIVSRNGDKYSVFIIDKGMTHSTTTSKLAWGLKKHFHLPPEVEYCVLANVLPLSPENRWSPLALDFVKSLSGKSLRAHVQDVLVTQRTFLLHIPCISTQMYEMGFARKLSPDMFQDFVLASLQSQSGAHVSLETEAISVGTGEQLHKHELFMHPELPAGTVETVTVTEVTNPHRIFCQLKVFSKELAKLSEQITQCCEGRMTHCIVGPEMIGFPCAARGSDGRWYRSVLQQVFKTGNVVEVLNIDYGTKQFVRVENVRPLAAEFFRMPVVTYICSLYGIIDKGVGWTSSQIDYLRTLILHKTVIAKFEYQSFSEGVHYVTLYGDENTNLNNFFGSSQSCLLECEKPPRDLSIPSTTYSYKHRDQPERNHRKMSTPGPPAEDKEAKGRVNKLPFEDLCLSSSHVAVVQHICDPSQFWIQTQNHANELDQLMDSIYYLYNDSVHQDVVRNPAVGLYCAAKAEDGDFYRAMVAEVHETRIKVFFVDYGNTEVVHWRNIRTLPDEFKKLPCLALKCTLAGVKPKDGGWNRSACEFFIKAVANKTVIVHITAKNDEGYAIHLTDPQIEEENDLGTLMCRSGFAERAETQRQHKAKMTTQPAALPPTQSPDPMLSYANRDSDMFLQTLNTVVPASNQSRIPAFKEHMFPPGSVLDVSVSYIESPNDFWCQLVQNAGHLKLLMHNIQAHYANSEFQPFREIACIARHPDNGMWYRALVIHRHETPHVNVLFVDYGQTEKLSLYDLRRIAPEFLSLHGQAFRCCLFNPAEPMSATNEWSAEAIARFLSFVQTAASNLVVLKCTIKAVMCSEQKIAFNIVDLETPFESISTSMLSPVKNAPPKKGLGPPFRLDTYYYSTHGIKIGTEEQLTVTSVNSISQFYCQLERNAHVIKDLKIKVNNLCHQLKNVKTPPVFGTLCFAKYTDGQWYRGQIKAIKPVIQVHFVDYGDIIEVEKSDLLPVPREANDIMSVPVQAVMCRLSNVPADVPSEANSWFETSVTECTFRALVVAREPDGKLLVELYHSKTQINSKLKKMFHIEIPTEEQFVYQGRRSLQPANHTQKTVLKQTEVTDHTLTINKDTLQSARRPFRHVCENGHKVKPTLQLYRPPHQRQPCDRTPDHAGNNSELGSADIQQKKPLPTETEQLVSSPVAECQQKNVAEKLPTLADLPSESVKSDMEADVYVSHCNSPLSFYVQLVTQEDEILSLVERLNDSLSTPQADDITDVRPGDLVKAEFPDDSSWYRAVVREVHHNSMSLVEFVDFGNTATIPVSKMGRLDKYFLQFPTFSTHCMLSDVIGREEVLNPKVTSAFKEHIGNGEKVFMCRFIRQSGSMWEVSLELGGVSVMCKAPSKCPTDDCEVGSEKNEQVEEKPARTTHTEQVPEPSQASLLSPPPLCYHQQEFVEGQKLEVYITAVNDTVTVWCQAVDADADLVKISSSLSKIGQAADHSCCDPDSLSPGSPCVGLFSEDNLWYRAEVTENDGDQLSVLFVDYGNSSKISVTDVREMPTDLMKTAPLAFLCELEGFDASHGCWDSGAAEQVSELTANKVLQLTVTRITREEGTIRRCVLLECDGLVINKALETWWSPADNISLHCDSTVTDSAPPENQTENPESHEKDTAACVGPDKNHGDEQNGGELVDSQTTEKVPENASSLKCESPGDDLHSESFVESPEDGKVLSESNMATGPQAQRITENLRGTDEEEAHQTDARGLLPCDGDVDEMFPPRDNEAERAVSPLSCEESAETADGVEEEDTPVVDATAPGAADSASHENPTEATAESLPAEVRTVNVKMSFSGK